ncbi:capsule biosynthesis protein [Actibacterium sp. XHP0104]|uniref:capsule biosynthesis protein n=1 Tax=Actibacterium sp. XHP0104 TaxID=2984335 RepID=UPI0021E958E5|nr:capsule biosynthesis protein [Actibacterium sp. XHP0104]MCV2880428.1 capsule biosynthesis protein [Actibacterium sp. XHP0104]
MTTKPRARKFRIRRSGPLGFGRPKTDQSEQSHPVEEGFERHPAQPAATGENDIVSIRKEGLTGRQLRMARRVAQKHGLAPTSDFDAVRLLRKHGIDPFQRANMLELVANDDAPQPGQQPPKLPQTAPVSANLPGTALAQHDPVSQVMQIQRDIARRRKRKLAMLFTRLAMFVGLPGLIAGYYYFAVATPMYATKSDFVIQQADAQVGGGFGSMFAGTGLAVQQDSTAVQNFLQSREAMQRLDSDLGFKAHFSSPEVDLLQRLPADATNEAAYKLYKRNVKIGFDPSEGLLRMEVIAADPASSEAFSRALISYAEERVDGLTQRLREDQMSGARASYDDAEARVAEAQGRVLELQERLGVLDPASETSALMSQINNFEIQLQEKRLQLQQLLDNSRPNSARVEGVRGDIQRLEALVAQLRASMTDSTSGEDSLARVSAELRIAEADLANRQLLLQQALQQLETARIEANRQVRYLSMGVSPVAPDEPTYPRAFENTVLAFLIFGGIYLMVSMTASILREQVSA